MRKQFAEWRFFLIAWIEAIKLVSVTKSKPDILFLLLLEQRVDLIHQQIYIASLFLCISFYQALTTLIVKKNFLNI